MVLRFCWQTMASSLALATFVASILTNSTTLATIIATCYAFIVGPGLWFLHLFLELIAHFG